MWALLASLHRRAGDLAACRRACLQGLRTCRAIERRGDRWRQAVSKLLNALGVMFFSGKQWVRAERCYLQAARVIDERPNPAQASHALNNVAAVRYAQGDLQGARACFQRVLRLTERSGDLWMKMTALANLGEVELALDRTTLAQECLGEAVRLGEQIRGRLDLPEAYRNLARAHLAAEALVEALRAARRSLELAQSVSGRMYLPAVLATVAEICAEHGRRDHHGPEVQRDARSLAREVLQTLDGAEAAAVPAEVATQCRELLAAVVSG